MPLVPYMRVDDCSIPVLREGNTCPCPYICRLQQGSSRDSALMGSLDPKPMGGPSCAQGSCWRVCMWPQHGNDHLSTCLRPCRSIKVLAFVDATRFARYNPCLVLLRLRKATPSATREKPVTSRGTAGCATSPVRGSGGFLTGDACPERDGAAFLLDPVPLR